MQYALVPIAKQQIALPRRECLALVNHDSSWRNRRGIAQDWRNIMGEWKQIIARAFVILVPAIISPCENHINFVIAIRANFCQISVIAIGVESEIKRIAETIGIDAAIFKRVIRRNR